jgi:DNA repair protein RadA/Sms
VVSAEVEDPSQVLLGRREERPSGVVVAATMEGMRPLLIEVQALVSTAVYGTPQRSSTGFDLRRLNMLLAVMEKRCGFRLGQKDVFLNLAGGFRVEEPAIDLAVVCAVLSSNADIAVPMDVCFAGEVGLTGEIRPVTRTEQRVAEAAKLGFARIFVPKGTKGIAP